MEHFKLHWKKYVILAIALLAIWFFFLRKKSAPATAPGGKTAGTVDKVKELAKLKETLAKCKEQEKSVRMTSGSESICKKLEDQIKVLEKA